MTNAEYHRSSYIALTASRGGMARAVREFYITALMGDGMREADAIATANAARAVGEQFAQELDREHAALVASAKPPGRAAL